MRITKRRKLDPIDFESQLEATGLRGAIATLRGQRLALVKAWSLRIKRWGGLNDYWGTCVVRRLGEGLQRAMRADTVAPVHLCLSTSDGALLHGPAYLAAGRRAQHLMFAAAGPWHFVRQEVRCAPYRSGSRSAAASRSASRSSTSRSPGKRRKPAKRRRSKR